MGEAMLLSWLKRTSSFIRLMHCYYLFTVLPWYLLSNHWDQSKLQRESISYMLAVMLVQCCVQYPYHVLTMWCPLLQQYIFAKTKGFPFEGYNSESSHHVYAFVSRLCSTGISLMSDIRAYFSVLLWLIHAFFIFYQNYCLILLFIFQQNDFLTISSEIDGLASTFMKVSNPYHCLATYCVYLICWILHTIHHFAKIMF
jgi:hypothetical protein